MKFDIGDFFLALIVISAVAGLIALVLEGKEQANESKRLDLSKREIDELTKPD